MVNGQAEKTVCTMYSILFVICLSFATGLCQDGHEVSTSGNGALPDCSSEEENIFRKCGASNLQGLEMQFTYMAGVMGYGVYILIESHKKYVLAESDADMNNTVSPQKACTIFDKYNDCVKNFHVREKCVFQLDGFLTFFWNYSCDPSAGYNDLSRSGECLVNENLMDSVEKQLLVPKCQQSLAVYYNVSQHIIRNATIPVEIAAWCAVRNISTDCFEPAFESVCGKEAGNFISGLYSRLGDLIKKRIGPSTRIRCNDHAQQMSNYDFLDDPKNLMNLKSDKHGENHREMTNDYPVQKTKYQQIDASIGDSVYKQIADWFGILTSLIQKDRGPSPVASLSYALMSHLFWKFNEGGYEDLIQQLKKEVAYFRTRLGSCSAIDHLYLFVMCFLESIPSHSGQAPSIYDSEKMFIDYCSSEGPMRLHTCIVKQLSPCASEYVNFVDDNINTTCVAHLAVKQDSLEGCVWPSVSGLEIKSKCNISTTELLDLIYDLMYTKNWNHTLKILKRVIPLSICADHVTEQLVLSRLSSGCSPDTEAKVKAVYESGQRLVSYNVYDFFAEYVHDLEILKNSFELGHKAPNWKRRD